MFSTAELTILALEAAAGVFGLELSHALVVRHPGLRGAGGSFGSSFRIRRTPQDPLITVYFGSGCAASQAFWIRFKSFLGFWHVQHEFVKAEKAVLGRNLASRPLCHLRSVCLRCASSSFSFQVTESRMDSDLCI